MTSYYLCNEGDVLSAALPTGLKLASETIIVLKEESPLSDEDGVIQEIVFTDKEQVILNALTSRPRLTIDDVSALLGQKNCLPNN
ncbi:hypothetical protein [Pedobacter steynii]